jgi:hypothetical protein
MTQDRRLDELDATARYHRERLALYRARRHGTRPVSERRMRELELASQAADARLRDGRGIPRP